MLKKEDSFSIPVYQRDYSWRKDQCRQFYDDLISMIINHRPNHFFGSIVDAENPIGKKHEYIIIDGQQRITTISLLILAFRSVIKKDGLRIVNTDKDKLLRKIDRHLYNDDDEIKLNPAPNCKNAYVALFSEYEDEFIRDSDVTTNYLYFLHRLEEDKDKYTADEIWNAIDNLTVIDIYLESDDDAQLIFESINSTGVALSESDKIRNYIMMSLDIKEQERYYSEYWKKIEANTEWRCDFFIRDYLTIQTREAPTKNQIYDVFKSYARNMNNEQIIKSMLKYSKYHASIYHPDSSSPVFRGALMNFRKLDMGVADPYIMQLFEGYSAGNIPENEVNESLEIIENYLFRRKICNIPSNGLNKIFQTLHTDVLKLKGNTDDYSERLKYILMRKESSGRFPRNSEFLEAVMNRDIYTALSEKNKLYLLERLENFNNNESHNIEELCSANLCSIEHVMPRTLNDKWIRDLGGEENAKQVHEKWLHKLGNLTFTGYNAKYSNQSFEAKLNMEHGFKDSTFSLNKFIASCSKWTEEEIKARTQLLMEKVEKIWKEPESIFVEDVIEEGGILNLAEGYNFTGKQIKGFTFEKVKYTVTSWKDFLILLMQLLYEKDKSIMQDLSHTTAAFGPANFIFASEHDFEAWRVAEIKDGIYVYTNSSTWDKLKLVKSLLDCYNIPHTAVEIIIRDTDTPNTGRRESTYQFWDLALPVFREKIPLFQNHIPTTSPWIVAGSGIGSGMQYIVYFTNSQCYVGYEFNSNDLKKNIEFYDYVSQYKDEIESQFGSPLLWVRHPESRRSTIEFHADQYRVSDQRIWDEAAHYLSDKLAELFAALQPILIMYEK